MKTKEMDCHQVVPLISQSGLEISLVISRNPLAGGEHSVGSTPQGTLRSTPSHSLPSSISSRTSSQKMSGSRGSLDPSVWVADGQCRRRAPRDLSYSYSLPEGSGSSSHGTNSMGTEEGDDFLDESEMVWRPQRGGGAVPR